MVFIDETGAATNMAQLMAVARAVSALCPRALGLLEEITFVAALRHDKVTVPCVFDNPIDGESFLAYVEQSVVATVQKATSS